MPRPRYLGQKQVSWSKTGSGDILSRLSHAIARRVGRYLERQGLVECDTGNSYLAGDAVDDESMAHLQGHAITYRIAVGPHQGRKVFTLKTLPARDPDDPLAAKARERDKLERLCRYITRPAISEQRLSLTPNGNVRYQMKTPYRDGTTHVIFEPLDFIARLPNKRLCPMVGHRHRRPCSPEPAGPGSSADGRFPRNAAGYRPACRLEIKAQGGKTPVN